MEKENKTALVTGANSGMGLATSVELMNQGFHVVMMCRNEQRGKEALEEAKEQSQRDEVELMLCDLGSLESIRRFADEFNARFDTLDVLINNAGVVSTKRTTTSDGFEQMLGVNHLGHFLLTNLLLEKIKRAEEGRIVTVSSGAHKVGKIHFDDPHLTKRFNVIKGYAQSKLANILFTLQLDRELEGTGVKANCVHPGAVSTSLGVSRESGFGRKIHTMLRPFFLTPAEGADTAVYLATAPELDVSGEYFYKRQVADRAMRSRDVMLAEELWIWSEKEVGMAQSND
ncbi:SDR family oxidoreductase [Halobacillus litoralis]|uniref:SDR family oxidoreductase n=1 Tax=Halobacillus litoralis TaxID=45668 RepID=UPI001CD699E3|nr:SDR family oxidoreductase [Halobacillus litoralis]MCA0971420.1 SDR family oxidoreductase [Halobacillus litoralis]